MRHLLLLALLTGTAQAGIISGGTAAGGPSGDFLTTSSAAATYVNKAGDTMTGRLTAPDATLTYGLNVGTISASGSITASSVTAGSYLMGTSGIFSMNDAAGTPRAIFDFGNRLNINNHGAFNTALNPNGGSVGIGTASPCSTCTLHVAGGASITGTVSSDRQPRAKLTAPSGTTAGGADYPIFWQTAATNKGGLFDVVASSQTLTVPTAADGWWRSTCNIRVPLEGTGGVANYLWIASNGSACSTKLTNQLLKYSTANLPTDMTVTFEGEVAAGATFTCCYYNATAQTLSATAADTNFTAVKVW